MTELGELKTKLVKMLDEHDSVKSGAAGFIVPDIFKLFKKEGYIVVKPLVPENITDKVIDGADRAAKKAKSVFRRIFGK